MMKRFVYAALFLLISNLFANIEIEISDSKIANAQTLLVELKADEEDPKIEKIYAAFEGKRYPFYKNRVEKGRSFYALVPTDYHTEAKTTNLTVVFIIDGDKYYSTFKIDIYEGVYKSEKLKVASSRAKISKKNLLRIKREQKEAMEIYNKKSARFYPSSSFIYPIDSKITSAFGNKRVFNGILKSYHSGTDFRAKIGTPVKAIADGRITLVKNRFFAGNSIIIDHGQGIYSGYYHLSKFKVKRGELVKRGEIIALAGDTGRVTGAHLHLSIRVNSVQVDPLQFIDTINLLFDSKSLDD